MTDTAPVPDVDQDERAELDFDAFWTAHAQHAETVRILGEDVELPRDVPLWLSMQTSSVDTSDVDTVRAMVTELYGAHMLEHWSSNGMGTRQMLVLLAWTVARTQGEPVTFAQAAAKIEGVAMSNPPASNRQERRAATKSTGKGKAATKR